MLQRGIQEENEGRQGGGGAGSKLHTSRCCSIPVGAMMRTFWMQEAKEQVVFLPLPHRRLKFCPISLHEVALLP